MDTVVVSGAAALVLFALQFAGLRGMRRHDGRTAWLIFAPILAGNLAFFWAAGAMALHGEFLLALPVALIGLACLAIVIRLLRATSRSVSSARSDTETAEARINPLVDYTLAWFGLLFVLGLLALFGLIAWGVIRAVQ